MTEEERMGIQNVFDSIDKRLNALEERVEKLESIQLVQKQGSLIQNQRIDALAKVVSQIDDDLDEHVSKHIPLEDTPQEKPSFRSKLEDIVDLSKRHLDAICELHEDYIGDRE